MKIAVIGAGLMGHGIALTMARAGHDVIVQDPVPAARDALRLRVAESLGAVGESDPDSVLNRIDVAEAIGNAVSDVDMVFEAAPEKLPLKQEIFAAVEEAAAEDAILASNTSVIPITNIMGHLKHRGRALGTHWWNPPHMIPLVEVIRTEWTEEYAMETMMAVLTGAGKTPVRVERDVPGFIGNRLQHAMWREAINLVERGICSAEAVDDVVKASFGRRLAVLGPMENADLVGLELTQDIHDQVLFDLDARPDPSPLLREHLEAGRRGMATGRGFREWTPDQAKETKDRVARHLRKLEGVLNED